MTEQNDPVIVATENVASGAQQLADVLRKRAEALDKINTYVTNPKAYTIYDLFAAAEEGGYRLNFNLQEAQVQVSGEPAAGG